MKNKTGKPGQEPSRRFPKPENARTKKKLTKPTHVTSKVCDRSIMQNAANRVFQERDMVRWCVCFFFFPRERRNDLKSTCSTKLSHLFEMKGYINRCVSMANKRIVPTCCRRGRACFECCSESYVRGLISWRAARSFCPRFRCCSYLSLRFAERWTA